MEADVKMQRQVACIMSDAFAKQAQPNEKVAKAGAEFAQDLVDKMKSEAIAKCAALRIAEEKGVEVFRGIRDTGKMPADAYFFAFVEDHEEDKNRYVSVGLFSSMSDCAISEGTLRENDLATTRCRKWRSTFYPRAASKEK